MGRSVMSVAAGGAAGLLTYLATTFVLAYTSAFAMPAGMPLALWDALVVFGLGAALVAFAVHFVALRLAKAAVIPALLAFVATTVAMLAANSLLTSGGKVLAAWLVGAMVASAITGLRSNQSFKSNPLRGAA